MKTLATDRLHLRPCTLDDVDALHALWCRPEVRRYLWDDVAIDRAQAVGVVTDCVESASAGGPGLWLLYQAGDLQKLAGFCALREISGTREVEVLYGLAPEMWGQALATEAAQAVLRYGFEVLGLPRIWARTDPPNVASRRVIERLGMRVAENPGHETLPMLAYVADRPGTGA